MSTRLELPAIEWRRVSPKYIVVDLIATPSQLIEVTRHSRRPRGIKWHLITAELSAATPPLKELARMRGVA